MRLALRSIMFAVLTTLAVGGGGTAAWANESIGPRQHFVGLVNGSNVYPVVYTVCPGPVSPGRTGPATGNLTVAHVASGGGYTGLFSQVYAWFMQDSSAKTPQQVKFTSYGTERKVPAAARVPCDGVGQVEFSSCPYLAPCAFGWIPDFVKVRFVNIAA